MIRIASNGRFKQIQSSTCLLDSCILLNMCFIANNSIKVSYDLTIPVLIDIQDSKSKSAFYFALRSHC